MSPTLEFWIWYGSSQVWEESPEILIQSQHRGKKDLNMKFKGVRAELTASI